MIISRSVIYTSCVGFLLLCIFALYLILDTINLSVEKDLDYQNSFHRESDVSPLPDNNLSNIFWFIQISDIHLSRYYDPTRLSHLRQFCHKNIDIIQPKLVIVTGDITDAKDADLRGSRQYKDEWKMYWDTLEQTGVLNKTTWLDIRGNHDAFDTRNYDSKDNYFRTYSAEGRNHAQSLYKHEVKTEFGTYSFIGFDACPNPGPKRPFNFFGVLSQDQLAAIGQSSTLSSNMTIFFGHYPTSIIVSPKPGIRQAVRHGTAYLCGHLHTLNGFVPRMYTQHKTGMLELELGDWKDNRIYRILSIDHDLLSFVDTSLDSWPVILITNPKQYNSPKEPLSRIKHSTHIRVLIFSPSVITSVRIEIDGNFIGNAHQVKPPLYILPWQPENYLHGIHQIKVFAKDSVGHVNFVQQTFSLSKTTYSFDLLGRVILMLDIHTIIKMMFFGILLLSSVPLLILRMCQYPLYVQVSDCHCLWRLFHVVINWLHLVAKDSTVFWCLMSFNIYVTIGPWFIGEILTGHVGAVFLYGIYVKGILIPDSLTYLYGFFQVLTFNIPTTLYLGHCIELRQRKQLYGKSFDANIMQFVRNHWPCATLVFWQSYIAYTGYYKAYGTIALILGPVRTWSVLLLIILRWHIFKRKLTHR